MAVKGEPATTKPPERPIVRLLTGRPEAGPLPGLPGPLSRGVSYSNLSFKRTDLSGHPIKERRTPVRIPVTAWLEAGAELRSRSVFSSSPV